MKHKLWYLFFLGSRNKTKPCKQLYGEAHSQLQILPIRPSYSPCGGAATEGTGQAGDQQ